MIKKLLKKLFGGKTAPPPEKEHKHPKPETARAATPHQEHPERSRHREAAGEAGKGARRTREERPAPRGEGGRPPAEGAAPAPADAAGTRRRSRGGRRRGGRGKAPGDKTVQPAASVPELPPEPGAPEPRPSSGSRGTERPRRGERQGGERQGGERQGGERPRRAPAEPQPGEVPEGAAAAPEHPAPDHEAPAHRMREVPLPFLPPIPPWTPPEDPTLFANYDLPPAMRQGIADMGFAGCTTVQSQVLPLSLQGKDVAAQSQTGTGKTAAFLITIFTRLLQRGPVDGPKPRALVIAPTRELAVQIEDDARALGAHTGLSMAVVFGGVDYEKQRQTLRDGADLVIGTPGRLIDYLKQGVWHPQGVEMLVIDEADRMLDMGFIRDLQFILKRLPHYDRRQSMLFSATMSWRVMELTYEYMNMPSEVRATPEKMTAERAEEVLYHVARDEKPALLLGIMEREKPERTMVFTNTKAEAEKVAKLLEHHGYRARGITGNLEQARRLKLMEEFKAGELPIMVATDVASRGLHIEAVSHVVNWDLPQDPEDYVHRIGRTARAGAAGKAISLADESGALNLEAIEKLIGYKVPVTWHEAHHLGEVKPGWREAAARERREREREQEAREGRHRTGEAPKSGSRGRRTGGGGGRGRSGGGRSGSRSR
jgi:ATP-dependent RNA helicase RhlB